MITTADLETSMRWRALACAGLVPGLVEEDKTMSRYDTAAPEPGSFSAGVLFLAFVAGFLAVPLFHQPMLALLHVSGVTPAAPYSLRPLPPLGVPQVASQSFWGGVWGIVFALAARRFPRGAAYWASAVLFGAFALSLVAWFIVAPLKGLPIAGGGRPTAIITGLLVNGAWGAGTAALLWLFRQRTRPAHPVT